MSNTSLLHLSIPTNYHLVGKFKQDDCFPIFLNVYSISFISFIKNFNSKIFFLTLKLKQTSPNFFKTPKNLNFKNPLTHNKNMCCQKR